jgi:hypothetical protein
MESNTSIKNPVLARILGEIKDAQGAQSATTAHNVYTAGVFEDGETNPILSRGLGEIKDAQGAQSATTAHNVYTSGVFEDGESKKD